MEKHEKRACLWGQSICGERGNMGVRLPGLQSTVTSGPAAGGGEASAVDERGDGQG